MKKKKWNRVLAVLLMMVMSISLLSGCGGKSTEKEDAETVSYTHLTLPTILRV